MPVSTDADAGDAAIADLARKARRAAWDPDTGIDWRVAPRRPYWLPQRAFVEAASQLSHGEEAALAACRQLVERIEEPAARAFLETQIVDEERHLAIYARYLARIGDVAPRDAGFDRAISGALAWKGPPEALVIACHLLLEGDAIKLQGAMAKRFDCPLLAPINTRVAQDEARHLAFGRLWLAGRIEALPRDLRAEIFAWLKGLWFAIVDLDPGLPGTGQAGLQGVLRSLRRGYIARNWERHRRGLLALGLVESGG